MAGPPAAANRNGSRSSADIRPTSSRANCTICVKTWRSATIDTPSGPRSMRELTLLLEKYIRDGQRKRRRKAAKNDVAVETGKERVVSYFRQSFRRSSASLDGG